MYTYIYAHIQIYTYIYIYKVYRFSIFLRAKFQGIYLSNLVLWYSTSSRSGPEMAIDETFGDQNAKLNGL